MAVENCVLSTSISVSGVATKSHVHLPLIREKCNLSTYQGLKRPFPSLSSSHSSSILLVSPWRWQSSSIVCNASKAASQVQAVTESSWESLVLGSQRPVLVDFWAPWCGPCKLIAPVIEELAKEYSGKIDCYKVNTDECPNIATEYNIRSIPTVLFFKNGERIESVVGAVPKTTLTSTIEKYLAS